MRNTSENVTVMHRLVFFALLLAPALAQADTVLYNGALNTTPDQQGWTYLTNPNPGQATQTAGGGVTTLDTTARNLDMAGYFSNSLPNVGTLNRAIGYSISFQLRLVQESHVSNDRAGFSLIALSSDTRGIELGFWTNEVWAQNAGFTHGEGASFNTSLSLTNYALTVLGNNYTLTANGTTLLTGTLRDYSAFGPPYTFTNFLFLGDNTTSASARVEIARVAIVPEPASWSLLALGVVGAAAFKFRSRYVNISDC